MHNIYCIIYKISALPSYKGNFTSLYLNKLIIKTFLENIASKKLFTKHRLVYSFRLPVKFIFKFTFINISAGSTFHIFTIYITYSIH